MKYKLIVMGMLTLATLSQVGCTTFSNFSKNSIAEVSERDVARYAGELNTYTDSEFKFSFKYPKAAKEGELDDNSSDENLPYTYARAFEYYKTKASDELEAGDYFVELYLYDHKNSSKLEGGCSKMFRTSEMQNVNGVKIYRGPERKAQYEYDVAVKHALCVEGKDYDLYLHGNEEIDKVTILPVIFDSFEITK